MPGVFFDTNILIYGFTHDDPRRPAARALMAAGGAISVQILNEFTNVARRKLAFTWPAVEEAIAIIRTCCPTCAPLTVATHEAAIAIAARYGFAFYDSLVIAAALETGCDTLLSEDMTHGQRIAGRLTIHNPFA